MVRNWDIIRAILLKLEGGETAHLAVEPNDIEGFEPQEVAYNLALMKVEGLVEAKILYSSGGDGKIAHAIARGMTWKGHELLDSIRNESIWSDVKKRFREKSLDMTVDMVMKVSGSLIASAMGLQ